MGCIIIVIMNGNDAAGQDGQSFEMLDNATSDRSTSLPVYEAQRKIVADRSLPLEVRLEALEDVYESEVGDTTLARARNIERELGIRQLYLKFEGGNPTGTQKDRIAFAQAMDALRRGYDTITMATCGNYGVAMAFAAQIASLRCVICIPEAYHTKRIDEMRAMGAEIVRVPGDYERSVELSRAMAAEREYYDANPGGANTDLQLRSYGQIAYEIYDDLHDAPQTVAVPVSNGTTLAGVYRGFLSLYRRGKTSRIPRIVAGSSYSKNPIVQAWLRNLPACEDLDPKRIRESAVNEPLINWHSIDGDHALQAIRASGGWAANATDRIMTGFAKILREQEGLFAMPASTAGIAALVERHRSEPLAGDRYVVVLTGRRA